MSLEGLSHEGLRYKDENGDEKLIPRANIQDGYKYTISETERKDHLMMLCIQKYPHLDKMTIELFVDRYMNHKDEMEQDMKNDTEYMKKFKM